MPDNTGPEPTPTNLEAFDLDGFIAGIVRPAEVVPIAQDARLSQQLHEAEQAVTKLEEDEANAKAEGRPSKRRAGTAESPELEQAREHLTALREHANGSLVFVRVEAETRSACKQALKKARAAGGDIDVYNTSLISLTSRLFREDPRANPDTPGVALTVEQWDDLAEAVGALQWDKVVEATSKVAAESVTPDFSRPASHSPDGDTSSKS